MCKKIQNNTDKPFAKHSLRRKDGRLKKNQFKQQIIKAFEAQSIWCIHSRLPAMAFSPISMMLVDRIHALTNTPQVAIFSHNQTRAENIARLEGISYGLNQKDEAEYSFSSLSKPTSST